MNHKKGPKIPSNILFLILFTISILFLLVSYVTEFSGGVIGTVSNAVFVPMQSGVETVGSVISSEHKERKTIKELEKENSTLSKKVNSLSNQLNQIQLQKSELTDLQKLYELDQKYSNYKKTGATIIARSSDNWFNTFTINKGSKDGIENDMNVIADGGLVGLVVKTGKHYSVVRAIIDDSSNVSGMSLNTGNTCIISGSLETMTEKNRIKITNLEDKNNAIKSGEPIVTSNISNKFVPGLLIGYVDKVKLDDNEITHSGTLTPAVDFKHLQNVLVIKTKKETAD
ncbi:MAG: rod shape-determining protein MreC [Lachnospiraceae bacterium]|nr:rod shape-determining protein MreC [Lachnospiraceae bacterium]